jgi:MFS family permease
MVVGTLSRDRAGRRSRGNWNLRKDLIAGHAEGAAYGGMVGLGETYLPAFALAVGLGEITAGLVASVPLLAGGLMQMASPRAIRCLGSHKRWVLLCALVQAASFVPLVAAALVGEVSSAGVLLVAAIYWGTGLATGPAWNTWMGSLVPPPLRARFFAKRTRLSQLAVLAGFVIGGAVLQWAGDRETVLLAFAGIFLAAGASRLVSLGLLNAQREPAPLAATMRRVPLRHAWSQIRHAGSGPLLLYLVVVQGVVQISGPYFTPYMFEKLELSYVQYVVLVAASFVAKVVFLPAWGSFAHRVGAMRLLWLGGVGIVPMASLWILSDNFAWLLCVQVLAGAAWAAYELAFFLMFFESIDEEDRTDVLTFYNLANTTAWVFGAAIGGLVLGSLGTSRYGYLLLFAVSSLGRLLALPLLKRVPSTRVPAAAIGVRTVGVRPMTASIDSPILPGLPDQTPEGLEESPAVS